MVLKLDHGFFMRKMYVSKRVIPYIDGAKQLNTDLKGMDVDSHDQELRMTILCGLHSKLNHLKVEIYAAADNEK